MGAAAHGNLATVKLLIEHGADPSKEDGYGYDAAPFCESEKEKVRGRILGSVGSEIVRPAILGEG